MKLGAFYKGSDLKKPTGGKKRRVRKTKKEALGGGPPQIPKLGENDVRYVERVRGGNIKVRLSHRYILKIHQKCGPCQ